MPCAAAIAPVTLFYATPRSRLTNPAAAALVDRAAAAGSECVACAGPVFAALAETLTPQGVLALLPMPAPPRPPAPSLVLVLDGVRDPGNAGALLRSAEAAGADLVIFGPGAVDPYNDKVLRAGMGAHFRLPLQRVDDWAAIRAQLAGLACFVAEAAAGLAYDQVAWRQPAALVIGGEADGPGARRTRPLPAGAHPHARRDGIAECRGGRRRHPLRGRPPTAGAPPAAGALTLRSAHCMM
jgi:TrmH family RNA methyltransferase